MLVSALDEYGGSRELINALASTGIKELFPPQALAVKAGLLNGYDSFVTSAPTASGKTLIAEMAALKVFFERAGKTIYLVPLRALAREKYDDLSSKYKDMRIVLSTGDYDSTDPWLYSADLIIATNEKMDSLIRHRASWLKDLSLVIADEIHLLGDSHRGPTLEVVLTRLRAMYSPKKMRFIALSATIPNASDIANWFGAKLVHSDWRPIPLREGVFFNGASIFNNGTTKWIPEEGRSDVIDLTLDTIKDGGQALIFVNTRKSTEAVARKVSEHLKLSEQETQSLKRLSASVLGASREPTRICRKLAEYISCGAAFHHAGINYSQRKLVEDAFRANEIKVIAATTTLAMGLNLPSRRVIIRDWLRYESGIGLRPIPAIEIKQMSGRAGRPKFDKYGEAVIVARNRRDEKYLFDRYITGSPEEIESMLGNESALRTHILASIAGTFTKNRAELIDFLGNTFFARQRGIDYLSALADNIVEFLDNEEMIRTNQGMSATRFGRRVSDLYIDPLTGVILRDALRHPVEKEVFSLLHMTARTPDMMLLSAKKKDLDEMLDIFNVHIDKLLIPENERYPSEDMLSEIKTASVLMQWILEMPEDNITGHFGIGPGDLHTLVELSNWLLYSAAEIGKIFNLKDAVKSLSFLRPRIIYGVREELLELVSLKGIGRVRARNLYNSGCKTLKDIKEAGIKELAAVPAIGKILAEDIKRQTEQ